MNDEAGYPDSVFNVSTRGGTFTDLGWEGAILASVRAQAEKANGVTFTDADWRKCQSLADVDALVVAMKDSNKPAA